MQVIGVVGFPASGKGEFSRIAKEMKIPVVNMGDVVRKAVTDAGLALNDKNIWNQFLRHPSRQFQPAWR